MILASIFSSSSKAYNWRIFYPRSKRFDEINCLYSCSIPHIKYCSNRQHKSFVKSFCSYYGNTDIKHQQISPNEVKAIFVHFFKASFWLYEPLFHTIVNLSARTRTFGVTCSTSIAPKMHETCCKMFYGQSLSNNACQRSPTETDTVSFEVIKLLVINHSDWNNWVKNIFAIFVFFLINVATSSREKFTNEFTRKQRSRVRAINAIVDQFEFVASHQ